ncbi:hypothetical protein JCM9279_001102 [Rhodotorula babjevae]
MLFSVDWGTLSSSLGVLSIVTWLFAQSPQVYLNFKNGSVEGLALPFLVSWFLGDFTNLVGCVLTHQLPFQTWLATYFILVDIVLCGQFAYYSRLRPVPHFPPLSEAFPYAQPSPHASFVHGGRRSRSRHGRSRSSRTRLLHSHEVESEDDPLVASWMTESSNASTATSPHHPTRPLPPSRTSSGTLTVPPSPTLPERGRTLQRSAIRALDSSLSTIHGSPSSHAGFGFGHAPHHHSSNHVAFTGEPDEVVPARERERQRTSSSRSRPPPPSRRSTGIVFLSVGALFTLGHLGGGGSVGALDVAQGGRAWSSSPAQVQPAGWRVSDARHPAWFPLPSSAMSYPLVKRSTFPLNVSSTAGEPDHRDDDDDGDEDDDRPPPREYDWERVVGRTSAWVCTTAYLTSRLPQIWQNFRRRSVEGLAMTLFAAAFLGNSLYVASILTNPHATSASYLLESMPYLLGSGGTLCFDLMIIAQSWLYSEKRKARRDRDRRRRGAHGFDAEEEAALLDADDGDGRGADGEAYKGGRPPHRSRSTSTLGHARSVSTSGSGRRPLSTSRGPRRSESTELLPGGSRPARFLASPRGGEPGALLGADDEDEQDEEGSDGALSRSVSRGSSTRVLSRQPSFQAIQEEGESSVTLRAVDD